MEEVEENARLAFVSRLLKEDVETTLDALVEIGRFLSGLPGRKNLIWIGLVSRRYHA